jgi:hypothetical protein
MKLMLTESGNFLVSRNRRMRFPFERNCSADTNRRHEMPNDTMEAVAFIVTVIILP